MLRDEMELYTKLTGEDATHVPIMKIGAYLDGYEKGKNDKPSGEWIPVSERLPEENTWVLCWYKYFRYGDYECMQETYGVGFYDSYGHWGGDVFGHKSEAIAWMPLPKPYKMESEDNK